MPTLEDILAEVRRTQPDVDTGMIEKAFRVSGLAHRGQKRRSGDPYFSHPAEVAHILATHRMDPATIATGLLHDVVEDTLISIEDVKKEFGPEVMRLVDGVTKLAKIEFRSRDVRQAESFRKMLLAMGQDIRVIVIKLADRLHNMRTLHHMSLARQIAIARETLDIYAPLANRLGISWMKNELEDLSFRYIKPEAYANLIRQLDATEKERQAYLDGVVGILSKKMAEVGIPADVSGRVKHPYSIFRKMQVRNLEFEQIADILAFRIIVGTVSRCYEALGHIHTMWKPVPGRFKDYIALPKSNFYQSLHTTMIGPEGHRVEVQIRTFEMHQLAEEGVAAHWVYKTDGKRAAGEVERFSWLRRMVDWQVDLKDSHEFIQTVKIDLFEDEVYVFTPRGDVLDFPRGATPIDFAYRIHTEVGHHCTGARVNGRIVPLKYKLQNGDTVEIITSDSAHPTKDWLKIAVTSNAKSKIRGLIKREERGTAHSVGREILEKELKKHDLRFDTLFKSGKLKAVAGQLDYGSVDDALVALGYGKLIPTEMTDIIVPSKERQEKKLAAEIKAVVSKTPPSRKSAIRVGGLSDVVVRYGKCCDPLPGDPILGFVTRGRGVTIHRADCYKVLDIDEQRRVNVEWEKDGTLARTVRVRVVSVDIPGMLANISKFISVKGANISHASVSTTADRKAIHMFEVSVRDAEQLNSVIRAIERLRGIISVDRLRLQ